jgi:dihydrofolate reductase
MTEETNSTKIVVWMQTSLDGYTAGPDGEFDWPMIGDELHGHFVATLADAGAFCYGRKVFEMMAGYWPIADELPDSNPNQVAYSKIWKPMPKVVVSRTLEQADWNTTVVSDVDGVARVAAAAPGTTYVFGGAEVVHGLAERDLVDEYQLFVHPIVLGGGTPLFAPGRRDAMRRVEARTFDDNVSALRYARTR